MIKTIVFQGDSHLGAGVGGKPAAGLRAVCGCFLSPPSYVNQLRRLVGEATGSSAYDVDFRS